MKRYNGLSFAAIVKKICNFGSVNFLPAFAKSQKTKNQPCKYQYWQKVVK